MWLLVGSANSDLVAPARSAQNSRVLWSSRRLVAMGNVSAVVLGTLTFASATQVATAPPAQAAAIGSAPCVATVGNATGVTSTREGTDCVVRFTVGSTTWTRPSFVTTIQYLVVGGGGGAGAAIGDEVGGNGGGGGEVRAATVAISADVIVQVGGGGAASTDSPGSGSNGSDSFLSGGVAVTARAGKGGGSSGRAGNPDCSRTWSAARSSSL